MKEGGRGLANDCVLEKVGERFQLYVNTRITALMTKVNNDT